MTRCWRSMMKKVRAMITTATSKAITSKCGDLKGIGAQGLTQHSTANNLKSFKSTFDRTITFLRWGGTNGLRFFLQFWYAKRPMLWIPRGWVPSYVEWILAFPRAPTGSVSIQMWGIACATVVQLVGAAVVAGVVLLGGKQQGTQKEKMAMRVGDGGGKEKEKEKKEL